MYSVLGKFLIKNIMNKRISLQDAVSKVKDGMTVMVGGFLAAGSPIAILDELAKSGVKDLTLICNDTAFADVAHGKLITNKQVKKVIVSHIGTNPNTSEQMNSGELEIEFSPQGTLAERVRAAGAGLGGDVGMGYINEFTTRAAANGTTGGVHFRNQGFFNFGISCVYCF